MDQSSDQSAMDNRPTQQQQPGPSSQSTTNLPSTHSLTAPPTLLPTTTQGLPLLSTAAPATQAAGDQGLYPPVIDLTGSAGAAPPAIPSIMDRFEDHSILSLQRYLSNPGVMDPHIMQYNLGGDPPVYRPIPKAPAMSAKPDMPATDQAASKKPKGFKVVFITGGSCSGKTTFCAAVVQKFPDLFIHVNARNGSQAAETKYRNTKWEDDMDKAITLDREILVSLEPAFRNLSQANKSKVILLDGFPRSSEGAGLFEAMICVPVYAVFLNTSNHLMGMGIRQRGAREGHNAETMTDETIADLLIDLGDVRKDITRRYGSGEGVYDKLIMMKTYQNAGDAAVFAPIGNLVKEFEAKATLLHGPTQGG